MIAFTTNDLIERIDRDGGFTIGFDGQPATSGFAVAGVPGSYKVEGARQIEASDVVKVLKSVPSWSIVALGGWKHEGRYYLELTEVYDSLEYALAVARHREQIAIYDLAAGTEITVTSEEE